MSDTAKPGQLPTGWAVVARPSPAKQSQNLAEMKAIISLMTPERARKIRPILEAITAKTQERKEDAERRRLNLRVLGGGRSNP